MSEYWKSTPKYWCKHCTAYVRDTPFERKQHESTAKHQNNLKRFLRDIQNDHERGQRDKERARAEVERLNRMTGGSTTTSAPQASAPLPTIRRDQSTPLTAADQKRQWQQLVDMGIQAPDHVRGEMAMSGNWQVVAQLKAEQELSRESLSVGVRKRRLEEDADEDGLDGETVPVRNERRAWGKSTRNCPGRDNDDLDFLLSSIVLRKQEKPENDIKPKPKLNHPNLDEAPTQDRPTVNAADCNENSPASDGAPAGVSPLKQEATDQKQEKPAINDIPEIDRLPLFKKRKGKSKSCQIMTITNTP